MGLVNASSPEHVVFTLNASDALNVAIKGIVGHALGACDDGEPVHLVTTWMDHNSVLRPFNALCEAHPERIRQTRIEADAETGIVDARAVIDAIEERTALVAVIHASNVSGSIQPVGEIGRACRARGVPMLVDAAQSAGHLAIDVESMGIDLLALPGHKGLMGPLGTGALVMRPGIEDRMVTMREGGTGSVSELDVQPGFMPDRFEPGSHNTVGLIGLEAGIRWVRERTVEGIRAHELSLMPLMLEAIGRAPGCVC